MMTGFEMWLVGALMGAVPSFIIGISAGRFLERHDLERSIVKNEAKIEAYELLLLGSKVRREV